ncbi:hypothetical protein Franean1_3393 [Parafrankia sp. EAN1pec]|uniref:LmeA family phospholipid-binding protein n=1 Tax=Parafrankia sp. (strain EAN1pec) TaxID=298653 RepID=UPI0000541CD1|nr:hypothetical protein Franean1_3393 [Frankia sp. EAN1pec]
MNQKTGDDGPIPTQVTHDGRAEEFGDGPGLHPGLVEPGAGSFSPKRRKWWRRRRIIAIGVRIEGISTPGPRISSVEAHLKGIHIPVRKILTNSVGDVPVDDVEATVHLDYADVNTFLADQPGGIQINPVGGGAEVGVSGRADVPVPGGLGDLTIVKASTDAEGLSLTATARDLVLLATETPTRHCPPVENGRA